MDIVTPERRSANMSRIRGKNTRPEMAVRHCAYGMGLRYRLHRKDLPGTPDLIFPSRRTALFVHGCFWHGHTGCKFAYRPKSNVEFWADKIRKNQDRDARSARELDDLGWKVRVIWECETRSHTNLSSRLSAWFYDERAQDSGRSTTED